uniref:Immunoglobulin subtype domain-containing protein n=1 Tax=Anolis carolinensis TaxID=28377 RepID=A0A803TTS6_ANOCA
TALVCGCLWGSLLDPNAHLFPTQAHLLSSSCVAQPSRNITIEIKREPPLVQVGDSVALIPGGARRNLFSCRWFRGDKYRFFEIVEYMPFNASLDYKDAYSGRESIDLYCRLHIRNLSLWDSNFYRIEKITSNNTWEAGETALLVQGKESGRVSPSPFPPNLPFRWWLHLHNWWQSLLISSLIIWWQWWDQKYFPLPERTLEVINRSSQ